MTAPYIVIQSLEAESSRLEKESIILNEAKLGNDEFFEGAKFAYDSLITFGVKKVPIRTGTDGLGYKWDDFKYNIQKLISRTVTGHAARDLISDIMDHCTNDQWNNWYRRILIKDLKCGASEKTFNTVCKKDFPQYIIPIFSCSLAHDSADHEDKMVGRKTIESKMDGVRLLTIVHPNGLVTQLSRNGKELENFEKIKSQFVSISKFLVEPMVFDGEIMSVSFQDLMKQARRKSDIETNDAILHLFDMIPLDKFLTGYWDVSQLERSERLNKWFNTYFSYLPNIETVGYEEVDLSSSKGQDRFSAINKKAIENKYEGVMIKDIDAPYECKRTHAWLKAKPFIEVSLKVVGYEEGTADGKNAGKLGALICEGIDDGKFIRVSCGGGFTDKQRAEIWACLTQTNVTWSSKIKGVIVTHVSTPGKVDDILGQIVEIRGDALTQNQNDNDVWSIRFPRFKQFRGFIKDEKI